MTTPIESIRALANECEKAYVDLTESLLLTTVDPERTRRRAQRYLAAAASLDMLADELEGKNGN